MKTQNTTEDEFKFPDETLIEDKVKKPEEKDDGDEIEIDIVDDTPPADRGRKPLDREVTDPTNEELESYSEGVKKRIAELTHARHDERRGRETLAREHAELQRAAEKLLADNASLRQNMNGAQTHIVTQAKEKAQADLDRAKADLKAAHEAFDTDKIVAAQDAMTDARMRLTAAQNFRAPAVQTEKPQLQPQQQPREAPGPDEQALRWQAKNQWFQQPGFEEVTSFALGLSQKLINGGTDPRSADYYEQLDARMKDTFPDMFGGGGKPKSGDTPRKPASVAASASRTTGSRKISLTTTQVALAKKLGITPQQYAVQVANLEKTNG